MNDIAKFIFSDKGRDTNRAATFALVFLCLWRIGKVEDRLVNLESHRVSITISTNTFATR